MTNRALVVHPPLALHSSLPAGAVGYQLPMKNALKR